MNKIKYIIGYMALFSVVAYILLLHLNSKEHLCSDMPHLERRGSMIMSQWDIKASDLQCIEKVNPNSIIVSRSAGGQLFGAHKIAQLIKDRGIDVHVNKECLSACTIILAAASKSTMCKSASIGVHHFGSNGKAVRNNQVLREHIDLMASFGINKKGYSDIMVNTPYTRFHYMNNKEMRDLGFITNVSLKCS